MTPAPNRRPALLAAALCLVATPAFAAPFLSLRGAGGGQASATIAPGTATFSLDVALDTDGRSVSGVQLHLDTTAAAAKYGATPLTALGTPFVAGDVAAAPAAGTDVDANAVTALFKGGAGDYAAVGGTPVARFSFDTAALAIGTYTFTPAFELFTNATDVLERPSDFGPAGTFTLTVGAVPEPATLAAAAAVAATAMIRRRR